jgi:hypothetical protein
MSDPARQDVPDSAWLTQSELQALQDTSKAREAAEAAEAAQAAQGVPPDRGPGQAPLPHTAQPASEAAPEPIPDVPEHARAAWEEQSKSLGRPPSMQQWRRSMGGKNAIADAWRRQLMAEAAAASTTAQPDSHAVSQARVTLAAAHTAVVKHTGVMQDFRDERANLVLALQGLHKRRAIADDVSIAEVHETEARIRAIDLELTEVFPQVLASLQAEEVNARRQLHQAVQEDQVERLNGQAQALKDFYTADLEPALLHLLDLGQTAVQKIGQIATARIELGLSPGDGARTLIAWFYTTFAPVFPHPLADQWRRLGRTWLTVTSLVETDTTLAPIQPEQLAEEVRRSRVYVKFVGPGTATLHLQGLERLQVDLQVDASFKAGRPIEVDRAEYDALAAHFGSAIERCLPTASA